MHLPEHENHETKSIIDYIRENLRPSANFTNKDIITAALVIQELVESGAIQTEMVEHR